MAYDSDLDMRAGEKRALVFTWTAGPGDTGTVQAAPAPSVTAYDGQQAVIAGPAAATGYDAAAKASPSVWWYFDTAALALAAGIYVVKATFAVKTTSTGLTETIEREILVTLRAAVEVKATYDPTHLATSPLFHTRFLCADTDTADADFSDDELTGLLSLNLGIPHLAAAAALDALAADTARLAVVTKKGTRGNDESQIYIALTAKANDLRSDAPIAPVVIASDRIFTMASDGGTTAGSMDGW